VRYSHAKLVKIRILDLYMVEDAISPWDFDFNHYKSTLSIQNTMIELLEVSIVTNDVCRLSQTRDSTWDQPAFLVLN